MANIFGYNQLFTPNAETWIIDGYIQVGSDGYTVSTSPLPKGIAGLTHNATGDLTLKLSDCWNSLLSACIHTELSAAASPALLRVQLVSSNVGVAGTIDGEQGVRFKLIGSDGSTAANLPASGGLRVLLMLKRSSA